MNTHVQAADSERSRTQPLFPFLDLRTQFEGIREEVMEALTRTLQSQQFILGPEVEALESEIANYIGCKYAIACASGSDALLLALMALGIGPQDEVLTTPFTFVATAGAIARLGAKPVFVDIDPATYNLDAAALERALTPKTRAVVPVHLYGLPAAMDSITEFARLHRLAVVEDAAQALGAECAGVKVGNLGTIGAFSFFPSKNLGAAGDGGMITTNDSELADRLRILRVHGSRKKYHCELIGLNSRLDALQAAILRVKLRHLEAWTQAREENARRYRSAFGDRNLGTRVVLPQQPDHMRHVFNQFVISLLDRDHVKGYLLRNRIPTEIYYPEPLHLQSAFKYLGYRLGDFPNAESASRHVLALPIYPELGAEHQAAIVDAIAHYYTMN